MMVITRLALPLLAVGVGCATARSQGFVVTSDPPGARVDVNGISAGATPAEVQLRCSKRWVGTLNAPDGWEYDLGRSTYDVTVYPSDRTGGFSQTKRVNACEVEASSQAALHFDTRLEPVTRKARIELSGGQPNPPPRRSRYEESLRSLKQLRDSGVISDEEYRAKVLKLAEEVSE